MLVLHGFWAAHDGLCLWAEDQSFRSPAPATHSGRPGRTLSPRPPAFSPRSVRGQAGQGGPAAALGAHRPAGLPRTDQDHAPPGSALGAGVLPWTAPVVMLYAAPALAAIPERAPGVRYGAAMDYLAGPGRVRDELVARGRVLPTLDHDGAGAVARWRPVIRGPDVAAMHALVAAMPPVCRAVPEHADPHEAMWRRWRRSWMRQPARHCSAGLHAGAAPAGPPARPAARDRGVADGAHRVGRPVRRRPRRVVRARPCPGTVGGHRHRQDRPGQGHVPAGRGHRGARRRAPRRDEPGVPGEHAGDEPAGVPGAASRAGGRHARQRRLALAAGDGGAPGHDEEPEPGWRLEFLLQSIADPSLLIPAEETWADDGTLSRWLPRPHELLLGELGRASRVYPELADGLRQAQPCALDLDADGAYRFLSTVAPALDEAGFGVLLPSWWDRRRGSGSPCPRIPPPGAWWPSRASSARTSSWTSAGGSRSATTRSVRRRSPRSPRPRHRWSGCAAMGGGGPRPAQAGPGVPRAEQGRADVRRGDPSPGCRPSRGLGHPAAGHRDPGRRLGRRVAGWFRFGQCMRFIPCGGFPRQAAALPGAGAFLAGLPFLARPRRVPGRRHGAGQDRAATRAGGADRRSSKVSAGRA